MNTNKADMKIEKAEVFLLYDRYILIKLTSDDGAVGWGEAHPRGGTHTSHAAVELAGMLEELENISIQGVFQELSSRCRLTGYSAPQMSALSGIDIALHDLVGRRLNVPIWSLLGGKVRDRVPVYVSFIRRDSKEFDFIGEIEKYLARGFRTIKLHTGTPRAEDDKPDDTINVVRSVREVWPSRDDLEIIVDVNSAYTRHGAIRVGRALQELDVMWFEEPIIPWDRKGFQSLQEALDVPIAAGENEHLLRNFRELIIDAGVDIVQPNLLQCGGFSGGMKIAALAEAFHRAIACNNWCNNNDPTLMTTTQSHFWVTANMCNLPQEIHEDQPGRSATPLVNSGVVLRSGYLYPPEGPGLGASLDEERILAESIHLSK